MRPYMIRKNGDVVDRETATLVGYVRLTSEGWKAGAEPGVAVQWNRIDQVCRRLYWTRWYAAMAVYEAWRRVEDRPPSPESADSE